MLGEHARTQARKGIDYVFEEIPFDEYKNAMYETIDQEQTEREMIEVHIEGGAGGYDVFMQPTPVDDMLYVYFIYDIETQKTYKTIARLTILPYHLVLDFCMQHKNSYL